MPGTHGLWYVLGLNAMHRTYNNLPVRSRMDPDATLFLPERCIRKAQWELWRLGRPHVQVVAQDVVPFGPRFPL
jgi:hypothetical protein